MEKFFGYFDKHLPSLSLIFVISFFRNGSARGIAPQVERICDEIIESIKLHLSGKPSDAYQGFHDLFVS